MRLTEISRQHLPKSTALVLVRAPPFALEKPGAVICRVHYLDCSIRKLEIRLGSSATVQQYTWNTGIRSRSYDAMIRCVMRAPGYPTRAAL